MDIKPEARKLALELGAVEAFDLASLSARLAKGNFAMDVTIDFAATTQSELNRRSTLISE